MRFRSIASMIAVGAALSLTGSLPALAFHGGGGGGHMGGGGGFHGGGGGFHGGGGGFHGGGFHGGGGGFHGGGFGLGLGLGAAGLGYGYGAGYYAPDYADGYDYSPGYGYGSYYAPGVQYSSQSPYYEEPLQTGRSAATLGDTCSTPVKVCTLYQQSYVGNGCSCKVPGGRSSGRVTP